MTTPTPPASPATLPWQDAENALFEAGYLYLGIADRPKLIEPAADIIRLACEQWARSATENWRQHDAHMQERLAALQELCVSSSERFSALGLQCNALREQLALCRAVLEECRPLVKGRLGMLYDEGTASVDDSILARIDEALKGGTS